MEALERSLSEIVRRHEVLRTCFASVDGEPVQVISAAAAVELSAVGPERAGQQRSGKRERSELAAAEAQQPFDLSRGPLLRVKLLRLGAEEHVLLLTMHHIVTDGWSMGVLIRELTHALRSLQPRRRVAAAELPIQYADFAVWQREWLQGEVLEEQLEYWREQLAGAPAVLELPTDQARPAVQSYRGAAQTDACCQSELSDAI